jgi:hypothetical protein
LLHPAGAARLIPQDPVPEPRLFRVRTHSARPHSRLPTPRDSVGHCRTPLGRSRLAPCS